MENNIRVDVYNLTLSELKTGTIYQGIYLNNMVNTSTDENIIMVSYKEQPLMGDNPRSLGIVRNEEQPLVVRNEEDINKEVKEKPTPSSVLYPEIRKYPDSVRGLVYKSSNEDFINEENTKIYVSSENIISYGLPSPYEFTTRDNLEFIETFYKEQLSIERNKEQPKVAINKEDEEKTINTFVSYEGTLIRLFYTNDRWYITTNRKLNAFHSSWCCNKSFGDLFTECLYQTLSSHNPRVLKKQNPTSALQDFLSLLDADFEYIFLIKNNNQNRVVYMPDNGNSSSGNSSLLFICRINKNGDILYTFEFGKSEIFNDTEKVELFDTPERIPSCYTFEEVLETVEDIDFYKHQGVIMFVGNNIKNLTQYKIYNNTYKKLFDLRANAINVLWRFIEIIKETYVSGKIHTLKDDLERSNEEKTNSLKEKNNSLKEKNNSITDGKNKSLLDGKNNSITELDNVELFYNLYVNTHENINSFVPNLEGIVQYIKHCYIRRYIMKEYIIVPKPFFRVMEACHLWHLQQRDKNRINKDIITDKIFDMETSSVFHLFKMYSQMNDDTGEEGYEEIYNKGYIDGEYTDDKYSEKVDYELM